MYSFQISSFPLCSLFLSFFTKRFTFNLLLNKDITFLFHKCTHILNNIWTEYLILSEVLPRLSIYPNWRSVSFLIITESRKYGKGLNLLKEVRLNVGGVYFMSWHFYSSEIGYVSFIRLPSAMRTVSLIIKFYISFKLPTTVRRYCYLLLETSNLWLCALM